MVASPTERCSENIATREWHAWERNNVNWTSRCALSLSSGLIEILDLHIHRKTPVQQWTTPKQTESSHCWDVRDILGYDTHRKLLRDIQVMHHSMLRLAMLPNDYNKIITLMSNHRWKCAPSRQELSKPLTVRSRSPRAGKPALQLVEISKESAWKCIKTVIWTNYGMYMCVCV